MEERTEIRGIWLPERWLPAPDLYAPARYRRPCEYETFVPDRLLSVPPVSQTTAGTVSDAEHAIRALSTSAIPALSSLARLLLRTEAVASSKIEGMEVDARTLARAQAKENAGQNVGRNSREIIQNIDAMQIAVELASGVDVLTVGHLRDIHTALMQGAVDASRIAGIVRESQNWIGGNDYNPCGAEFVPPPAGMVDALLDDLVDFVNDDAIPPLTQAAFAHAQFELIHPFADGNGRTGRALVQVILRRRGVAPSYVPPISVVLAGDKEGYIRGLEAFRDGDEERWLEQFAVAAARAAALAETYLSRVNDLQVSWREKASEFVTRRDAAAWQIIEQLPAHPIISIATGVGATNRTRPAVSLGVDQLVRAGVLTPLSSGNRNRHWEAIGLLDLIAELDSGQT